MRVVCGGGAGAPQRVAWAGVVVFKQKTAYELRISDWGSDVCSSELVDSILRQQSGGKKSIDDFAHAFFGMRDGDWGVLTYTLDDVVATLNGIQPYDWAGFLNERQIGRAHV